MKNQIITAQKFLELKAAHIKLHQKYKRLEEEMNSSPQTISKRVADLDRQIVSLKDTVSSHKAEIARTKKVISITTAERAQLKASEIEIKNLKESVNRFSAERSKWLRKLKRAGVSL